MEYKYLIVICLLLIPGLVYAYQVQTDYTFNMLPPQLTLIYGEMFCDDCQVTIDLTTADKFESLQNLTVGKLNGFTFANRSDGNATLTTLISGTYHVSYSISYFASRQDNYETGVAINGIGQNNTESHRKIATVNDIGNVGGVGILSLNAGDNITLQVKDEDTPVGNVIIDHVNFVIIRIGD